MIYRLLSEVHLSRKLFCVESSAKLEIRGAVRLYQAQLPNVHISSIKCFSSFNFRKFRAEIQDCSCALLILEDMETFEMRHLVLIVLLRRRFPELGIVLIGDSTFLGKLRDSLVDHFIGASNLVSEYVCLNEHEHEHLAENIAVLL